MTPPVDVLEVAQRRWIEASRAAHSAMKCGDGADWAAAEDLFGAASHDLRAVRSLIEQLQAAPGLGASPDWRTVAGETILEPHTEGSFW